MTKEQLSRISLAAVAAVVFLVSCSGPSSGSEYECSDGEDIPVSEEGWILYADRYDSAYSGVPVANGIIGILPWKEPFSVRNVMLNGLMERSGQDMVNRAVKGICPFGLSMSVDGNAPEAITDWSQAIDMRQAVHTTEFTADGRVCVSYSFMALRNLPYMMLMDVEVTALDDVSLEFVNVMDVPEGYRMAVMERKTFWPDGRRIDVLRTSAGTSAGSHKVVAASAFMDFGILPDKECVPSDNGFFRSGDSASDRLSFNLLKGQSGHFTIAASLCSTADFCDPWNETVRQLVCADRISVGEVKAGHYAEWDELWKGDVMIEGDIEAQQAVRLALFSLYGSCRAGSGLSIPPMGLSSDGYGGHIFWDAEMWMFTPMLVMNTGIAGSMMEYRTDRLAAARKRAMASGYAGAMFPWESDVYGEESTPVWALTGPMEHHITADVGLAAWKYWCATRDMDWLETEGWPLLESVAEFCTDRVRDNGDGSYSIPGVVGADEYACNVTDNAFTNGAVAEVLECAARAARLCGRRVPPEWMRIAGGLRFHSDTDGVTMEYDGYDGRMIKQADVNLLGYPLSVIRDRGQLMRDLAYYESRIDPVDGPAMTWSIFCVQYARLGDIARAEEMFRRCYRPFSRPPFGAMAETPSSDNPYFMTGAGGLLQAVLFGFAGLEITERGIECLGPALPPSWKRLVIRGAGPERRTYVFCNDDYMAAVQS